MMQKSGWYILILAIGAWFASPKPASSQNKLSVAGEWQLRLDPADMGLREYWWLAEYADRVKRPGSLTENGKGNDVNLQTPWVGDVVDSMYFVSDSYKKYREDPIKIPFWLKPLTTDVVNQLQSSNYQWQDLVSHSQTVILNDFPKSFRPLIQPIDTWFENRRLSLAFEGRVGKGKLLVCSIDLESDLARRPAARQLKYSLLTYMNSGQFKPADELAIRQIQPLFQQETSLLTPAKND